MKIATYNMRNFYDGGTFVDEEAEEPVSQEMFLERVTYFTELFRPLDIDIICLQEVGGEKGVFMIGEVLGYDCYFAKPNKRGIRMAVMYKKALAPSITCSSVSFGELSIPSIQEQGDTHVLKPILQRRDVLVVDVDSFHDKKLRIVTFHLKSNLPMYLETDNKETDQKAYTEAKFRCVLYKMMELRGIRGFVDTSMDEGREIVLLGDFNENNNSSAMDILKGSNQDHKVLTDVLVGYEGDKTTHIYRANKLTFDTILVSSKIQEVVEEVSVLNKDLQDFSLLPLEEVVIASDHAMVTVTLR